MSPSILTVAYVVSQLLELDRTVASLRSYTEKNYPGQTAIMLTANHSQAYDVFGSVDTQYFNALTNNDDTVLPSNATNAKSLQIQKRFAIGTYADAGWPNLIVDPKTDLPTQETLNNPRYKLAGGKVDRPPHTENYQARRVPNKDTSPLTRQPSILDPTLANAFPNHKDIAVPNPDDDAQHALTVSPNLNVDETVSAHSLQTVDIYCSGPDRIRMRCSKVMDNIEVFFIMADVSQPLPTSYFSF